MRFCQVYLFFFILLRLAQEIYCKQCPEIKILNNYKIRSYIVEGLQIPNSTIQLLRGGPEPGTQGQINNIMVWDTSTNNVIYVFDLDLQISKMIYCKNKRKLIVAGTHKIVEIHPLTFKILNEHNVGGTHIHDVLDDDDLLLISRDNGNPFTYNINTKQVIASFPYQFEKIIGLAWSAFLDLKDFKLYISGKLIIFDRSQDLKFITILTINGGSNESRVVAVGDTNMMVSTAWTNRLELGLIYKNSQGVTSYLMLDNYYEIYEDSLRFYDLYYANRNGEHFIIGTLARTDTFDRATYKGATVVKVVEVMDSQTQQKTYKLQLQEQWKYRRWRKDMEFFVYDETAQRGHSISEYEHFSFEFLESDFAQCDFDGDGIFDSQCRMAKTISHWPWQLFMGVYFTGSKGDNYIHANDDYYGYRIRDFNQTDLLVIQFPRLIDINYFSCMRVIQSSKSTYLLPQDTFIFKMGWQYIDIPELKEKHNTTAGFYVFQLPDLNHNKTDTYNLIEYMNPTSNSEKYKNLFTAISTFTYEEFIHICLAYIVTDIENNYNEELIDLNLSHQYFSHHQKECYKIKSDKTVQFFQLKLLNPIDYSPDATIYSSEICTPYFDKGQLICKNTLQQLEIWSLSTYKLIELVNVDCKGLYDLQIHRQRLFLGCDDKVAIYNFETKSISTLLNTLQRVPRFLLIVHDIFILAFSNIEIWVYDLSASDGSAKLVFQYLDPQDCCVIQAIDFHHESKKILWASGVQINMIDLSSCLLNPEDCLTCEMNAYFKYDPNFSFVKQKYERASWSTPISGPWPETSLPQSWPNKVAEPYVNQKFLDNGLGTKEKPYLTDMSIIQFYYKTMYYKQNFINFKTITLNLYFDTNKEQQMSNHLLDWQHPKTKIIFHAWDSTQNTQTTATQNKIKISILSYKNYLISIQDWFSLYISNVQIACPLCSISSLSFQSCGEIYLSNFKLSLKQSDLIDPLEGQQDMRIFPNIQIEVNNVAIFFLENQFIGNTNNQQFAMIPFFSFIKCQSVTLKDVIFSNISNQESIFVSEESSIFLENITFTKLNTCKDTSQRSKFSLIPFNQLEANNITFDNNDFCDICLFENIVSSSSSYSNVDKIKVVNIKVTNNRFSNYKTSTVVFFKMSLVAIFVTNKSILIQNIVFQKNVGKVKTDKQLFSNIFYFELVKLSLITIDDIQVIDEQLVGLAQFSQINDLSLKNLKFMNSQFLPENSGSLPLKYLIFNQMMILATYIDKMQLEGFDMSGFSFEGTIAINIQESLTADLTSFTLADCLFKDSLFTSISNMSREITSLFLINSLFLRSKFTTDKSHIQVGLFWIKAEQSTTIITLTNNTFTQNFLSINYNTQKKSTISISIDNSISDLKIDNCKFNNFHADSVNGDLFLNVKTLKITKSAFSQNLSQLQLKSSPTLLSNQYIQEFLEAISLTKLQGTFITVQAQDIDIQDSVFQNAISKEGSIQIYPNNNELKVQFLSCTFKNLFASTSNSAIFLQSKSSPVTLNLTDSHFINLWLGNIQSIQKAHIFIETDSFYLNKIYLSNIDAQNIGILQSSDMTINQQSTFIQTTNSSLYFENTTLNSKSRILQQLCNSNENIQEETTVISQFSPKISQKIYQIFKLNRILLQDENILFSIMQGVIFYSSSLIKVLSGPEIIIKNIEIHGNALISQNYKNVPQNILQPVVLEAYKSQVKITNLQVQDIIVNQNGGIMLVQESKISEFQNIVIKNVNITPLSNDTNSNSLENNLYQSRAFLNCIQTYCSYQFLKVSCDKLNKICQGRIINHQEGSFSLLDSSFENYQIDYQNGTALIIISPGSEILIANSTFSSLSTTESGGAIYIFQNKIDSTKKIKIMNNTFENNKGQKFGGAISLESLALQAQDILQITNNTFSQNTAKTAAAIYYFQYYLDPSQVLNNIYQQNHAILGDNIFSQPERIHIQFDDNSDLQNKIQGAEQNDELTIMHASGLQLSNLEFKLNYINQNGKEEYVNASFLQQQKDILQIQMSLDKKTPYDPLKESNGQLYYAQGSLTSSYNETSQMLYFSNIDLFGLEKSTIYLIITSPFIKKKQTKDIGGMIMYEPYKYIITVVFRQCSEYEIITTNNIPVLSSSVKRCQLCPELSFSNNKQSCEQCPIGAECNYNQQMLVQSGYWRASLDTYNIIQCTEGFEGCIGGQGVGNEICLKGYIGPMCSECDLFDERGDGKFTRFGKKLCRLCSFDYLNSLMLIGTIFTSIYLTIRAIQSNTNFIKAKILVKFLRTIKFKNIRDVEQLQNQNILIKILMTYFQLISVIRTVDIKVPDFLPEMSFYFGNPASNATLNINCFMKPYLLGIHFLQYNYFLIVLVPFIHFLILFGFLKLKSKLNREKMSFHELKTAIIFFFTFFQPEFVYQAIQIITCKQIDKLSYNQSNLSFSCNIGTSYFLILSMFIICLGFLIPLILYSKLTALHKNKSLKEGNIDQSALTFLSLNYKPESYYWEFVRMAERLLFIMVASIFNYNQYLKIIMLIFITEGYYFLILKHSPFKNFQFNKLEIACNHVISASFVIAIGSYSRTLGYALDIVFYILFLFINWIFISYVIILIAQQKIHQVTDALLAIIQKNRSVQNYLECIIKFLNMLPFFKMNFDLKVYLMQRKKPEYHAKFKDALLNFLKMNIDQRMAFMISLKEYNNKNKFVSEMMSSFSDSVKRSRSPSQQPFMNINNVKPSLFKSIQFQDDDIEIEIEQMKNSEFEEIADSGVNRIIPSATMSERKSFTYSHILQNKQLDNSQKTSIQNQNQCLLPFPNSDVIFESYIGSSIQIKPDSGMQSSITSSININNIRESDVNLIQTNKDQNKQNFQIQKQNI